MYQLTSLDKTTVAEALERKDLPEDVRRVLELRQQTSKTSNKKFDVMVSTRCKDDRIRGTLQFYGANRSGRYSGKFIQPQNFPRSYVKDLDLTKQLIIDNDYNSLRLIYGNVPDTLSQMLRCAMIPSPGNLFIDCDFSAIEARVLAWMAGEEWVLDVFRTTGKIYEATYAQAFGVPLESVKKHSPERQQGKVMQLACIAEGELVLTDHGEKPIEQVTRGDMVWNGSMLEYCEGAIKKGKRKTGTLMGFRMTPDHLVYCPEKDAFFPAQEFYGWDFDEVETETYDLLNCGYRQRFTLVDKNDHTLQLIVHNCGYGGSEGAMARMDFNHEIDPALYKGLVEKWRSSNPNIVKFWYQIGDAVMDVVKHGGRKQVRMFEIALEGDAKKSLSFLTIRLPSGRKLFYVNPGLCTNRFGNESVCYMGSNQVTRKWEQIESYGPKFVENATQAIARDLLCEKIVALEQAGLPVVFSIHDEIVCDVPKDKASLDKMAEIMSAPVSWAEGLPLAADGWIDDKFKKD